MKEYQLLDDQGRAGPLSNFLGAHRGYRRDADRFPAGLRGLADRGFPAEGLAALQYHWRGYDAVLLDHHHMEDELLFPMMREKHPEIDAEIDELAAQHEQLDEQLAAVTESLAKLPEPAAVEPALEAFEALAKAVNQHLDLEETHVVPFMLADPPLPPGGGPRGPDGGDGPPGPPPDMDAAFVAPWLADGLDDATIAALMEFAPPPLQAGFTENRRRYQAQLRLWAP